jgi:hypothetical protein
MAKNKLEYYSYLYMILVRIYFFAIPKPKPIVYLAGNPIIGHILGHILDS